MVQVVMRGDDDGGYFGGSSGKFVEDSYSGDGGESYNVGKDQQS